MNSILLRYGEIGLKSKRTRAHFEKKYVLAIEDALKRNGFSGYKIENMGGRFVIHTNNTKEMVEILQRVPGIQSISPAVQFEYKNKDDLLKKVKELALKLVKDKTFCVRAKRIGEHDFTSHDLEKEAGAVLYDASKGVDLHNPEITIKLEVRKEKCFLYTETEPGIGGLPPQSSGKVLALFSGGIDSPVAAFQMLKRGCAVDFLFINLLGEKSINEVAQIYNYLINQYAFAYKPKLYVVDGTELVSKIQDKVQDNLRQIALKITFYQIGEKVAEKTGHFALVTGEALSQKSSQTIQSLKVIESQIKIPVLRPLIGFDKIEITKIAQEIGTLASSEKVQEYCNLSQGPVKTAPDESVLEKIPVLEKEIDAAVKNMAVHKEMVEVESEQEISLTKPIVTVDLRLLFFQDKKPLKTDLAYSYREILKNLNQFEKDKSYLIICDLGVKSKNIAFALRKKGIKAIGVSTKKYLQWKKKNE